MKPYYEHGGVTILSVIDCDAWTRTSELGDTGQESAAKGSHARSLVQSQATGSLPRTWLSALAGEQITTPGKAMA